MVGAGLDEPSIPQGLGNSARARRTNAVMQHTPLAHQASLCPHLQALAALLVCEAADDCHGALRVVEQWVPAGDRCLLHLDARHLGTDKGALQVRSAVHCLDGGCSPHRMHVSVLHRGWAACCAWMQGYWVWSD